MNPWIYTILTNLPGVVCNYYAPLFLQPSQVSRKRKTAVFFTLTANSACTYFLSHISADSSFYTFYCSHHTLIYYLYTALYYFTLFLALTAFSRQKWNLFFYGFLGVAFRESIYATILYLFYDPFCRIDDPYDIKFQTDYLLFIYLSYAALFSLMILLKQFLFHKMKLNEQQPKYMMIALLCNFYLFNQLFLSPYAIPFSISDISETFYVVVFLYEYLNGAIIYLICSRIKEVVYGAMELETFEQQKTYAAELTNLNTQLEQYQKNSIRFLASMGKSIRARDRKELEEIYQKSMLSFQQSDLREQRQLAQLHNLKITELKSLLTAKLIEAQTRGIVYELEIKKPVTHMEMDIIELIRVMGIFLDNAIEAAVCTDNPVLSLSISDEEEQTVILLTNSCQPLSLPVNKLREKGVTSKESGHGLGLYITDEILQNYPNIIWSMWTDQYHFTQKLIFIKD